MLKWSRIIYILYGTAKPRQILLKWVKFVLNANQTTPWKSLKNRTRKFISYCITVVYPSNLHVDLDLHLDQDS
jgi:hypothetical protein